MRMMRGDMAHDNRGEANPGTDVTHFFSLSLKVGQRGQIIVEFQLPKSIVAPRAGFEPATIRLTVV